VGECSINGDIYIVSEIEREYEERSAESLASWEEEKSVAGSLFKVLTVCYY
jgi:hypothetical protein